MRSFNTRIFDTIFKVDKSFKRRAPWLRTQAGGNQRFSPSNPRVTAIGAEPPATSLHNVGSGLRRPANRYFPLGGPAHNQPRPTSQ